MYGKSIKACASKIFEWYLLLHAFNTLALSVYLFIYPSGQNLVTEISLTSRLARALKFSPSMYFA